MAKMKKTGQEPITTDFKLIKEEYERFYTQMMLSGQFPLRQTEFGYWGYSVIKDVFQIFRDIKLNNFKNFIDLGSGDGKVVLVAGLFTNSAGFELDKDLFTKSVEFKNKLAKKINIKNEIKFENKNYLNEDLSKYNVLYHYPDKRMYEIENKLLKEMKKDAILIHYGNYFFPLQLRKVKEFNFNGMRAGLYKR